MKKLLIVLNVLSICLAVFLMWIYQAAKAPTVSDLGGLILGIWCFDSGFRYLREVQKEKELLKK